jgi:anti-sigma B factor antagonist
MDAASFDAHVRAATDDPAVTVIDLVGEINRAADERLMDALAEAAARDTPTVLLNFSQVTYINSTGIAVIVGLLARARAEHLTVGAYGLMEHYREIFEITRLADFMTIFSDEERAVGGAAPAPAPSNQGAGHA